MLKYISTKMLRATYLVILFSIGYAEDITFSENLVDGVLSSEVIFIASQEPQRAIETDDGTSARDNLSGGRRTVKDEPEASGTARRIRYPGANSVDEPHASLDRPRDQQREHFTGELRTRSHGRETNAAPVQDTKIYFHSDEDDGEVANPNVVEVVKPQKSEDNGKIYFETMLPKMNSTKPGIVNIDGSNSTVKAIPTSMLGGATGHGDVDSLDNRDAFKAVGSCNSGEKRVNGKCVTPD